MNITTTLILSIAVFLGIVLLLVDLLLIVRNKLMPKGKVKITINGEKELQVQPGNSLMSTLADEKVFLPSACGGKGNCGQCSHQRAAGLHFQLLVVVNGDGHLALGRQLVAHPK